MSLSDSDRGAPDNVSEEPAHPEVEEGEDHDG